MWGFFKKRQKGDLRRLASAYRCMLKAASQAGDPERAWKGGFGKAYNQIFMDWPSPNQSRRFERLMHRWLKKAGDPERAFILAFNDYLGQRRLAASELEEVLQAGRDAYTGP